MELVLHPAVQHLLKIIISETAIILISLQDREQTLLALLWWVQLETEHLMLLLAFMLFMG